MPAAIVRVFNRKGEQVGAAALDEVPAEHLVDQGDYKPSVIEHEDKHYKWSPKHDQWRETTSSGASEKDDDD